MTAPSFSIPGQVRANLERLNGPDRLAGVDLARGLAVFGMLVAHLLAIAPWSWTDPTTWVGVVQGRSSILFATIAGLSLGLVAGGRHPAVGVDLTRLRVRLGARAAMIWLIGLAIASLGVPVYVILPAYAILFLLAIPALGLSTPHLIVLTAGIAVLFPFAQAGIDASPWWETDQGHLLAWLTGWHYPFLVWSAFLFTGLALSRCTLHRTSTQLKLLIAGVTVAAAGYTADGLLVEPRLAGFWAQALTAEPHSSGLLEVIASGGFAVAVIALCLLLGSARRISALLLPVRAVGSMPLTAYVLQVLTWAFVASMTLADPGSLSDFRALHPLWPFLLGTLVFCTAWALLVGRGPLESALTRLKPTAPTRKSTPLTPGNPQPEPNHDSDV